MTHARPRRLLVAILAIAIALALAACAPTTAGPRPDRVPNTGQPPDEPAPHPSWTVGEPATCDEECVRDRRRIIGPRTPVEPPADGGPIFYGPPPFGGQP